MHLDAPASTETENSQQRFGEPVTLPLPRSSRLDVHWQRGPRGRFRTRLPQKESGL